MPSVSGLLTGPCPMLGTTTSRHQWAQGAGWTWSCDQLLAALCLLLWLGVYLGFSPSLGSCHHGHHSDRTEGPDILALLGSCLS